MQRPNILEANIEGKRALRSKTVRAMTRDHFGGSIKNNVAQVEQHRDGNAHVGIKLRRDSSDDSSRRPAVHCRSVRGIVSPNAGS